jgi:hypothetical protein
MGKRQTRVDYIKGSDAWSRYKDQEVNVVCLSGIVYHGLLMFVSLDFIQVKDLSGNTFKLVASDLKELIIDYVSH